MVQDSKLVKYCVNYTTAYNYEIFFNKVLNFMFSELTM